MTAGCKSLHSPLEAPVTMFCVFRSKHFHWGNSARKTSNTVCLGPYSLGTPRSGGETHDLRSAGVRERGPLTQRAASWRARGTRGGDLVMVRRPGAAAMAALVVGLCAAALAPLGCEAYVVPGSFPRDYTLGQDLEGESVVFFGGELSLISLVVHGRHEPALHSLHRL